MKVATGDYLLPVDKPVGPTSHDVVAAARRALGTRRVGHTGTLDPFASGLLVLCVGATTRLAEYLSGLDKSYRAVARLGVATDTHDLDGAVVSESEAWRELDRARIEGALEGLRGTNEQIPPQFSAKKIEGEAMHRRARRGEHVALAPATVTVFELVLDRLALPDVHLSARCSSGTYVRALARDLGEALGVGAHLTALRRTAVGSFRVDDAIPLDALDDAAAVEAAKVAPIDAMVHFDRLDVDAEVAARLAHGQRVRLDDGSVSPDPTMRAVTHGDELLAIAELADGVLKPRKVFAT